MCRAAHHSSHSAGHDRGFDTLETGILLEDIKDLEPAILHLVKLPTDVQSQVKYKNKLGETFKQDIG